MASATATPVLIKPEDIVRTPRGRTARVVGVRRYGFRLLEDVITGELTILHVADLFLVRSAVPKRWPRAG